MKPIRLGSLMIRIVAVFFAAITAYGTYLNISRQPVGGNQPAVEQAQPLSEASAKPPASEAAIDAEHDPPSP